MIKYKLDELDHQILDILVENSRTPFTDIAKTLNISAGTVNIRVKKMEDLGLIKGSTISVDYDILDYNLVAYIGIFLEKNHQTHFVIERLLQIPFIVSANVTSGQYNIFCKIRVKDLKHAKDVIFNIDDIQGVIRTETIVSLHEPINDEKRIMHKIFADLS